LAEAAAEAKISFNSLYRAVHGTNPDRLSAGVVAALCGRLKIPLSVVSPSIHSAVST
jgi:hypothetical protein